MKKLKLLKVKTTSRGQLLKNKKLETLQIYNFKTYQKIILRDASRIIKFPKKFHNLIFLIIINSQKITS